MLTFTMAKPGNFLLLGIFSTLAVYAAKQSRKHIRKAEEGYMPDTVNHRDAYTSGSRRRGGKMVWDQFLLWGSSSPMCSSGGGGGGHSF
jgi:hypothetical protein